MHACNCIDYAHYLMKYSVLECILFCRFETVMRNYAGLRVAERKVETFLSLICNIIIMATIIIIVMFRGVGRGGGALLDP